MCLKTPVANCCYMIIRKYVFFFLLTVSHAIVSLANPSSDPFVIVNDGVIVYTNPLFTGTQYAVKLQVVANNIIRVLAAPGKEILPLQSLVTVFEKDPKLAWDVVTTKERVIL